MPALGAMFLISAFSLAGLPPFSGFWAKFALVRAGLQAEQYLIVGVALVVSILTLFSMTKIWSEAFWKKAPYRPPISPEQVRQAFPSANVTAALMLPIALIAVLMVVMGVWAGPLFALSEQAANQLLNPDAYIQAVCGVDGCMSASQ
jgi:multicomponent Na+:H+ antiporter subunit D